MGKRQQAPIKFAPQQSSGQESLAGAQPISMNVFIDQAGAIRKRPGLRASSLISSDVIDANGFSGLHLCLNGDVYMVAEGSAERPIWRIKGGAASKLGGGVAPAGLRGTGRPVFAETEMLLVIAGGDLMQKVELLTTNSNRLGGNPPVASHVIAQSQRLLANDLVVDKTKIRYSGQAQGTLTYAGNEDWTVSAASTASGFLTAEARPDPVNAIGENTNTMFAFGQTTLQLFTPDPTFRWAPTGAMEAGTGAPYSPTKSEQVYYWIDDIHRAQQGGEQGVKTISGPIQKTLDDIDITGAFGYRVFLGPLDAVVFTFPASGQTFAYQEGVGWSQWSGWDGSAYTRFAVSCLDSYKLAGTHDGRLCELSMDAFDDLGTPIRAYIQSGFQDHGSPSVKDCSRVILTLKRGQTTSDDIPVAQLKWRDQPGPWEEPILIDLGQTGDTYAVVDLPGLGTYRQREWCFEFTGSEELALVGAVEEFETTES